MLAKTDAESLVDSEVGGDSAMCKERGEPCEFQGECCGELVCGVFDGLDFVQCIP